MKKRETIVAKRLNAGQRKAACARDGPLLVLAGAGTGKTTTVAARIGHLIEVGRAKPEWVLAIAFTNKAARELRERIAQAVGEESAAQATIGTFHSACHRQIRPYAERFGRTLHFTIYDKEASSRLLAGELEKLGTDRTLARPVLRAISLAKAKLEAEEIPAEPLPGGASLRDAYRAYEGALRRVDAVDFDDLIVYAARVLKEPAIGERFRARWRLIVVDEYQDTNDAQRLWLKRLADGRGNVTVVGDDDQSIFAFRGANVGNIWAFERDFAGAEVVTLSENYRSTAAILAAASRVVGQNTRRRPKELRAARGQGDGVRFEAYASEAAEAEACARWCGALATRGVAYSEMAILYRTNGQAPPIERELFALAVPYTLLGGRAAHDHKEVRDALAYLALVQNPRDAVAFQRVAKRVTGVGPQATRRVVQYAEGCGLDVVQALKAAAAIADLRTAQRQGLKELGARLCELAARAEEVAVSELVGEAIVAFGVADAVKQGGGGAAQRALERLRDLVRSARRLEAEEAEPTLEHFLAHSALAGDEAEAAERVTLATVHAAKGLEWGHVRVVGMEEGLFPHARASDGAGGAEEERRLCYVAMTRAKEELCLSFARLRRGRNARVASRFLAEAGFVRRP